MISSGIKRGLAATAVGALAVTGLPFLASSASAIPLVEQEAAGNVTLQTPAAVASFKNDGVDSTVHLVATGGSDVQQVQFQYDNGTTWVNIGSPVSRVNGVFSTEWAPPASIYNTAVDVRASALGSVGTEIDTDDNTVQVTANAESVNISNAPGSQLGWFAQTYTTEGADDVLAAVSGTTSDVSADPDIEITTPYNGTATTEDVAGTVAAGATSRTFSAPVNLNGYPVDGTAPLLDQALIIATADGDDAEPVTLYQQSIGNVTATAESATVQGSDTTDITVKVVDQNGNAVVGAQVVSSDAGVTGEASGTTTEYTNSQGEAVFEGADGTTSGTSYGFLVNSDDEDGYQSAKDFQRSVTVTSYTPAAASLTATSADGAAFDFNENDGNDIQVTVRDQSNAPVPAGTQVSWQWVIDPFDPATPAPAPINGSGATVAGGTVDVTFPAGPAGEYTLNYWVNRDGTPGEGPGDLSGTDLVVKAGNADVVWADDQVAQAASGTTATFEGSLELEDGTGLPGRNLSITWTKNPSGNAVVAAQAGQPAGTTRVSDTTATTTTAADGGFGVALSDPAVPAPGPQVDELDGTLTATTTATPNIGNALDSSTLEVDFLRSVAPAAPADIDVDVDDLFGAVTPGRPVDLDITVYNDDNIELTDYPVEISVDHGFLSPNAESISDLTPDPAPAEDGEFGEWASDGTENEYTTDDSGETGAVVAIERDEAFDTSPTVTTTVTVTAGNISTTVPVTFTTDYTPVNPGEVSVELADEQTVSVLPDAPTTESVWYDVFVTDQFDNLLPNQSVEVSDDLANAYMDGSDGTTTVSSNLLDENPSLELESDVEGDQTVSAEWAATTRTYTDSTPATPAFDPTVVVENVVLEAEAAPVNWYEIDFATSTYSITHTGGSIQPVGSTVTVTYKAVDQNGEPIEGLWVTFYRTGPDDLQDGDGNSGGYTNEDGEVFYVYQGAKAGTAVVTAVLQDGPGGSIIPQGEQTDTVQFGKDSIDLKAAGKNNGKKADKLRVTANDSAAGLVAKVFVKGKKVAQHRLDNAGDWNFTIKDKNGKKATKYVVKVAASETTSADQASKKLK